jgi:hypothetical protein
MIEDRVRELLYDIEAAEGVKVLYACESGSRAWGFASSDSDYDVRIVYIHPPEWYLTIENRPDVIERPLQSSIDLSGWDARKALQLFRKSNPPLFEWLRSPIVYLERSSFASTLRELAGVHHSAAACAYHYLHMAQGNFREYLRGNRVLLKKYFYVLRPILAVNWIERGLGIVPMEFRVLLQTLPLPRELVAQVEKLLDAKQAGDELDDGPRISPIHEFIERELDRLSPMTFDYTHEPAPFDKLDAIFQAVLKEVWQKNGAI